MNILTKKSNFDVKFILVAKLFILVAILDLLITFERMFLAYFQVSVEFKAEVSSVLVVANLFK